MKKNLNQCGQVLIWKKRAPFYVAISVYISAFPKNIQIRNISKNTPLMDTWVGNWNNLLRMTSVLKNIFFFNLKRVDEIRGSILKLNCLRTELVLVLMYLKWILFHTRIQFVKYWKKDMHVSNSIPICCKQLRNNAVMHTFSLNFVNIGDRKFIKSLDVYCKRKSVQLLKLF